MKVKTLELIKFLSNYKEEYIDIELLKVFCYPQIQNIENILECLNTKVIGGKHFCTKSEFARFTNKSRVTINDWIEKGVLIQRGKMIDLHESYHNLKTLHKLMYRRIIEHT